MEDKKIIWFYLIVGGLLLTALFFRFYYPKADLPLTLSWQNAATQDASWYSAAAVHKALGLPKDPHGRERHLDKPIFTWYCFLMYSLFGVSYTTNTLLSAFLGMATLLLLFYLLVSHLGYGTAGLKASFAALALLSYNYTAIAFSRVPLLYTPINLYILMVIALWMVTAKKRPFLTLLPWALVGLGYFLKIIVPAIALGLIAGHFVLLRKNRDHKKVLLLLLATALVSLPAVYFFLPSKFWFIYNKFAIKLTQSPTTLGEKVEHLFRFGDTSRFFLRNPFFFSVAILFPMFFLMDRRKISGRVLEVIFLVWFLTILLGTMMLKGQPLRFLSLLLVPMAGLWSFLFEKALFWKSLLERKKETFLDYSLSWREGLALVWFLFGGTFILYHSISEVYTLWTSFSTRGILWFLTPADMQDWGKFFWPFFLIGLGMSLISLSPMVLFFKRFLAFQIRWGFLSLALCLSLSIFWNLRQTFVFLANPTFTQYNFAKEMPSIIGKKAHLAGAYAHALTLGTKMDRSAIFRMEVAKPSFERALQFLEASLQNSAQTPLGFIENTQNYNLFGPIPSFSRVYEKRGITHLALPRFDPDVTIVENYFRQADTPLWLVRTIYLRGWKAHVYRICWKREEPGRLYLEMENHFQVLQKEKEEFLSLRKMRPEMTSDPRLLSISLLGLTLKKTGLYIQMISRKNQIYLISHLLLQNLDQSGYSFFEKALLKLQTSEMAKKTHQTLLQAKIPSTFSSRDYQYLLEKAYQTFEALTYKYPYSPFSLACKAKCQMRLGHWEEAKKNYEKALALNPYDGEIWEMFASFYELRSRNKKGAERIKDLVRAANCVEKMVRLYQSSVRFKQRLQSLYLEIERLRKKKIKN